MSSLSHRTPTFNVRFGRIFQESCRYQSQSIVLGVTVLSIGTWLSAPAEKKLWA